MKDFTSFLKLTSLHLVGSLNVAEKLSDMDEVSVTKFDKEDIVRNKLITKILERID